MKDREPGYTRTTMTLRVYRVGPDGAHTTIKDTVQVQAGDPIESPLVYPPCQCGSPRCKTP